jgi:DNA-binding transcriptional LysR family regulator
LGVRLFERSTQGVALTNEGRRLLPYARKVGQLLREAQAQVERAGTLPALRLGLTSALEPSWFGAMAERLQAAHPDTAVSTVSDSSPRLVRQLRSGRLDAVFVALPTEAPGLNVVEVDRLPMVLAIASSHPLARRRSVRLADLASEPVFWFERARQPAFFDHCMKVFERHRFAPSKLKEPLDQHVLLAQVAAARAAAFLPRSFAALQRAGVAYRPLVEGDELSVGIGLATPPERPDLRTMLLAAIPGTSGRRDRRRPPR